MTAWGDLIAHYSRKEGIADRMKVASLAQWIVESGRGTSALSQQDLNFGGLKYRDRMRGFASPVDYTGSDSEETTYCKLTSVENFVDGYWHFINSGPYPDYQTFRDDAAGYIRYIARQGYSPSTTYVAFVLGCFQEATSLLNAPGSGGGTSPGVAPGTTRVGVIVGHNERSQGSYAGEPINEYEYPFNTKVANAMAAQAGHYGLDIKIFIRQPADTYATEIAAAYDAVQAWGADCSIELHFNNADSPAASGTHVLCRKGERKGKAARFELSCEHSSRVQTSQPRR